MEYQYVPFITLLEIKPRVWITIAGCNFKCKACFSPAKNIMGKKTNVDELVSMVKKASLDYYHKFPGKIIITGAEPTLNRDYMTCLLSKLDFSDDIIMETNSYILDEDMLMS